MDEEQLKAWLKENLVIETSSRACDGNNIRVQLRFVGEDHPFSYDIVPIPDPNPSNYY